MSLSRMLMAVTRCRLRPVGSRSMVPCGILKPSFSNNKSINRLTLYRRNYSTNTNKPNNNEQSVHTTTESENNKASGDGDEQQDSKQQQEEEEPKKSWFKLRYFFLAISPIPIWYFFHRQVKKEITAELRDFVVSSSILEIAEMMRRTDISVSKMQEFMEKAPHHFKNASHVSADDFGRLLKKETESEQIDVFDVHPLLRNSPVNKKGEVDFKDCLVAVSMLVETEDPNDRLALAWKVEDDDLDGKLSFGQFETLLRRMIQTGHFNGQTVLRRTGWIPPSYNILSAQGLAVHLYEEIDLSTTDDITLEQFSGLMKSKKVKETGQVWYYDASLVDLRR